MGTITFKRTSGGTVTIGNSVYQEGLPKGFTGYRDADGNLCGFEQGSLALSWAIAEKGDNSMLLTPVTAHWAGLKFEVLPGYRTDGLSKPRLTWTVVGHPYGDALPGAIVHDILYDTEALPRDRADACFNDLIRALPVPRARRILMYGAVRAGGAMTWWKHTDASREAAWTYLQVSNSEA